VSYIRSTHFAVYIDGCRFAFKTRLFALHDATSHRRLQQTE
jgi:hypothetical protein